MAQLHDIGKLAVPDSILLKPGPLDASEWEVVRQHTLAGERIVGRVPGLDVVADAVRASHERWDGLGYPDGLAGHEIPLAARIVAVADAYAAMTTPDRPYREPLSPAEAEDEVIRCAGTQFDPVVVEAFLAVLARRARDCGRGLEPLRRGSRSGGRRRAAATGRPATPCTTSRRGRRSCPAGGGGASTSESA